MIGDWLRQRAQSTPENIALIAGEESWNYRALDLEVDGLVDWLSQAGVRPGEHVAALLPNCAAYVLLVHALARLGAMLVPLNTRLSTLELESQVTSADCVWLVADNSNQSIFSQIHNLVCRLLILPDLHQTRAQLAPAHAEGPHTANIVLSPTNEPIPNPDIRVSLGLTNHVILSAAKDLDAATAKLTSASVTISTPDKKTVELPPWDLNRVQALVFTSGTTGQPKGAQLTFGNHLWSAIASAFRLGVEPNDRWLVTLPFYHVGGLAIIFRCVLYGAAMVLAPKFEPHAVLQAIELHHITLISLVPTMLQRLLEQPQADKILAQLRLILLGGALAPASLLQRSLEADLNVAVTYGMTETASQIATARPDETREKPGCAGKPLEFCLVRILDENGQPLPAGEIGQIAISGPVVMKGYYRQAPVQGELLTGDLGMLDRDGDLWIYQRRSDLILCGGENIYPVQVEAVLLEHPLVAAACVVGVEHPGWGQQVAAAIVTRDGATLSVEDIQDFCRQRLAGYKIPRQVRIVNELPQTHSGKVLRTQVVELFCAANMSSSFAENPA
jgi:O-succinylbenzoic acid--CoA ligase